MNCKVNVNHPVKIKLTQIGINVLKEKRDDLNRLLKTAGGQGVGDYEVKTDEEGYTTFSLWEVMHVFGPLLTAGVDVPFETDIIITKSEPIG